MQRQKHPNFYQLLLSSGAKVLRPCEMSAGSEKGKGRMWKAKAKLRLDGYDIFLEAMFHGGPSETIETAQANLNVTYIRMYVEGGKEADHIDYTRASYKALMLMDGIYICPDHTPEVCAEMRKLIDFNTSLYIGIPDQKEYERIIELGYKKIISW